MGSASAPCLRGYTRAWAAQDDGLHGTHSAAEAWPVEQPARGLCPRAVGSGIRPAQCQRGWMQAGSSDGTPQSTTADTMAEGGRCKRGHPRDEGVVTGGRRSGGNCDGNASERAAGEDLGEDDPDRWVPSVSDGGVVMGWQAGSHEEMGRVGAELGRPRRKRPMMVFQF
jgi:hypothetical protein